MTSAGLRTLLGECLRQSPGRTWLVFVLAPLLAVAPGLTGLGLQWTVDGVLAGSRPLLVGGAVCVATAGAFSLGGGRFMQVQLSLLGNEVGAELNRRIMRWCATLPTTAHLEDTASLRRIERIRGLGQRIVGHSAGLLHVAQSGLWLLVTTVLLIGVHPMLVVLPLFAVPSMLLTRIGARRTEAAVASTAERVRMQQHLFTMITEAGPAKELRLGTSGEHAAGIARRLREERIAILWRNSVAVGGLTLLGLLLFVAAFLGALYLTGRLALAGSVSPGALLLVATLGSQIRGQLGLLSYAIGASARGLAMIDHYLWLRDLYQAGTGGTLAAPDRLRDGVTMTGVTFSYGGPPVLHDIDLHLPAGATVALVGDHGSGKTTLVKLLCGFHRPSAGTITVDGRSLALIDPEGWRERVTSAFQDFSRFPFLAGESVGVGNLPQMHDIAVAAGQGGADQVFARLPEGEQTRLGKALGDGVELSGGQWQKIALSRAFMRSTPLLAVLDEPTAALDAASEYGVYQQYAVAARQWQQATGGITLLVSHRFATIRMADLIVVLDHGRIIERGTHAQLIDRGGRYAHLYNLQSSAYQ
jgi:ATP-binding cassette subfamily B protein